MILRGALLSENRLSLEPVRPVRRTEPEIPVPVVAEPKIVERIVPAPITRESVTEWLEQDEDDPREWLSQYLANDIEDLRAAARSDGFAAGEAEGLARAKEQTATLIRTLTEIEEQASHAFDIEIESLSGLCADVVCAAITKIGGPLLGSREAAAGAVLEVLKRVKEERELLVRVNAHDLPALQEQAQEIERACGGRRLSFVEDARVEAGGCIVESRLGTFDGRFDVQLRRLSETLRDVKSAPPGSA